MDLKNIGWNEHFEAYLNTQENKDYQVARVFAEHKHSYKLFTEIGEVSGEISGKMRFEAVEPEDYPAVGDWVMIVLRPQERSATIHGILPRRSKFSRKAVGDSQEQILATNIDTVFLVNALNRDFNVRRIERYLILAWESGANPVIILSKADLCDDAEEKVSEVEAAAPGVPIHVVSAVQSSGMADLKPYLKEGCTVALLGSSGVGKSTLLNYFTGNESMKVNEIRATDDKGKHTSTHREIFLLPEGGLIIDTPGMREIQLWNGNEGIAKAFSDVDEIAKNCAFRNCNHEREPGCAVKAAIANGQLPADRYESFLKLQKEVQFMESKQLAATRLIEKKGRKVNVKDARSRNGSSDFVRE